MAKRTIKRKKKKMKTTVRISHGVVTMSFGEYKSLMERVVPEIYLTGKEAKELDRSVEQAMRDHKAGRTRKISSFKDLLG